jgi:hypothetical protein
MKKSSGKNYLKIRNEVHEKAVQYIRSGISVEVSKLIAKIGKVQTPIPIYNAEGKIVSWFTGVTIRDRIVSFLQFDNDLRIMRYSTFLKRDSYIESCPKAFTWLDPKYIVEQARKKVSPDDELMQPFMTYDGSLSRIVWAVETCEKRDRVKTIFVIGSYVYLNRNELDSS